MTKINIKGRTILQYNVLIHHISPSNQGNVQRIFITHMHADHIFGLPSVILHTATRFGSETNKLVPLEIYGPSGLYEYNTWQTKNVIGMHMRYKYPLKNEKKQ